MKKKNAHSSCQPGESLSSQSNVKLGDNSLPENDLFNDPFIELEELATSDSSSHRIENENFYEQESINYEFQGKKFDSIAEEQRFKVFLGWSKKHIREAKNGNNPYWNSLRERFKRSLKALGVDEEELRSTLGNNKKEFFEKVIGESVAVFAMIFAWKKSDKEKFSQALGELGMTSLLAFNPITGLITLVGIAIGFNKLLYPNAIKKGGLIALSGLGAAYLIPGGILISLMAAIIAAIVVNTKVTLERPVVGQVKEMMMFLLKGEFKACTREKWSLFENSFWKMTSQLKSNLIDVALKKRNKIF